MRKIALALAIALSPAAAATAASLGVPIDQSIRVTLRDQVRQVIVGNPAIADVTVADPHHLIITGKTGGVTNLIVTDIAGRDVFDRQLVVSRSSGDHVVLISGPQVVSYACAPSCAMVGADAPVPGAAAGGAGYQVTPPAPSSSGSPPVQASPNLP